MNAAGSVTITSGIRIAVTPSFLADQSDPEAGKYVFGYRVKITNESGRRVQLLRRRWVIIDAEGSQSEVEGEGVIGQQPELEPGDSFLYHSFCPLQTPWGTMEGTYTFIAAGEEDEFEAVIGRFYLVMASPEPAVGEEP
jgi:ApaG protein